MRTLTGPAQLGGGKLRPLVRVWDGELAKPTACGWTGRRAWDWMVLDHKNSHASALVFTLLLRFHRYARTHRPIVVRQPYSLFRLLANAATRGGTPDEQRRFRRGWTSD